MAKPVIMTVDDEPHVLNAVERDLRRKFGSGYRILKAPSGEEALRTVKELKKRNAQVALLLVDQRMPSMSGTEFIEEAAKIFPDAKKALLTAYADTQTAITSINEIGLDYYLMKPWDPPERELYPVLEDLLDDWSASVRLPFEGVRVVGYLWSSHSHAVKDFLSRNQVPYRWLDAERDGEAKRVLAALNGERRMPVVLFPDGSALMDPGVKELAEKVGLQTKPTSPFYDLVIVGGGPAGLAAAVYGGSEGLRTVLVEKEATGGQAGTSSLIENYLGFPRGLSGSELAKRATAQAKRFGVEILMEEAVKFRAEDPYRYVRLADGGELSCYSLLITTGVSVRLLEVPGASALTGAGVYYGAANTEAASFTSRDVVVAGGGNSAAQAALYLARYAHDVYLAIRGGSIEAGMSSYLVDHIGTTENIHVLLDTEIVEVGGNSHLEFVLLANRKSGENRKLPASALFVYIGAAAHTGILDGVVELDPAGFILTGQDLMRDGARPKGWAPDRDPFFLETSVPGVFAAGDVRHQSVKRVASAVGEGAVAVALVHQYLKSV
jgi:thioredoxin reductase (NADPH)